MEDGDAVPAALVPEISVESLEWKYWDHEGRRVVTGLFRFGKRDLAHTAFVDRGRDVAREQRKIVHQITHAVRRTMGVF